MKRFSCWLRFGHIWYDVGPMTVKGRSCMMIQCRHCVLTRIVDLLDGANPMTAPRKNGWQAAR